MASIAPIVFFCDRSSSERSEVATGSFVVAAGAWARANVVESANKTIKMRFTEEPPGHEEIWMDVSRLFDYDGR